MTPSTQVAGGPGGRGPGTPRGGGAPPPAAGGEG
jgi:hypothetical protein